MLILTRKKDESIVIDGNIEVKIIGIEENKVKLGISAPKNIEIHRKEIYLQIQEENKQAALGKLDLKDLGQLFKK
ncbi:MAG: carbon storage regulator [Candidatus Petromonas sp.]|nr:carbon storage regulator [Candidatus Petromonas sp.]